MWSPSLVPKPRDWGNEIDVVGYFLPPDSDEPPAGVLPPALLTFLSQGPKPIFVGFGRQSHGAGC
jgi:hypothetical protein